MDFAELLRLADSVTTIGLLFAALVAYSRGIVVSRRELRSIEQQRDQWRGIALQAMNIGERSVEVIKDSDGWGRQ